MELLSIIKIILLMGTEVERNYRKTFSVLIKDISVISRIYRHLPSSNSDLKVSQSWKTSLLSA